MVMAWWWRWSATLNLSYAVVPSFVADCDILDGAGAVLKKDVVRWSQKQGTGVISYPDLLKPQERTSGKIRFDDAIMCWKCRILRTLGFFYILWILRARWQHGRQEKLCVCVNLYKRGRIYSGCLVVSPQTALHLSAKDHRKDLGPDLLTTEITDSV